MRAPPRPSTPAPGRIRRGLAALGLAAGIALASPAYALVPGVLSGETQLLAGILAQELSQVAKLSDTLIRLQQVLQGINDVAASARAAVRLAESVANLEPEALLRDLRYGALATYPEAAALFDESVELADNVASTLEGRYWQRYSRHDARADRLADAALRFGYRGSATALFAPLMQKVRPGAAEFLVERYFRSADLHLRRRINAATWYMLARQTEALRADAEQKRSLPARIQANVAAIALQTGVGISTLADLETARAAEIQHRREREAAHRKAFQRLGERPRRLFAPPTSLRRETTSPPPP